MDKEPLNSLDDGEIKSENDRAVENSEFNRERISIIVAFWAVVLIGLPFWWATTTIERLPLPRSEVEHWSSLQVHRLSLGDDRRLDTLSKALPSSTANNFCCSI